MGKYQKYQPYTPSFPLNMHPHNRIASIKQARRFVSALVIAMSDITVEEYDSKTVANEFNCMHEMAYINGLVSDIEGALAVAEGIKEDLYLIWKEYLLPSQDESVKDEIFSKWIKRLSTRRRSNG